VPGAEAETIEAGCAVHLSHARTADGTPQGRVGKERAM
jgi:hypothetical protein